MIQTAMIPTKSDMRPSLTSARTALEMTTTTTTDVLAETNRNPVGDAAGAKAGTQQ